MTIFEEKSDGMLSYWASYNENQKRMRPVRIIEKTGDVPHVRKNARRGLAVFCTLAGSVGLRAPSCLGVFVVAFKKLTRKARRLKES